MPSAFPEIADEMNDVIWGTDAVSEPLARALQIADKQEREEELDRLKDLAKELVGPNMGALIITHYQRILNYIKPDFVHVFVGGKIVEEGGPELAQKLEVSGYEQWEAQEVPA